MSANAAIIALLRERGPLTAGEVADALGRAAAPQVAWLYRHGRVGRTGEPRAYRYTNELDDGAAARRAAQQVKDTAWQRKYRGNGTRAEYHARVRADADLRQQQTAAANAANALRRATAPTAPVVAKASKPRPKPKPRPESAPAAKALAFVQQERSIAVQRPVAAAAAHPLPPKPRQPELESVDAFLARGGRIQRLSPGAASQPLRHHGP